MQSEGIKPNVEPQRSREQRERGPIVRLIDVWRAFQMGEVTVEVLCGVSLELLSAELTVVEGPSGSGKTTMLNLIGGLDRPTRGQVWFKGMNLAEASAAELTQYRRRHVGFVFQFYNLISSLTVRENVLSATELVDGSMEADEVLELVGLGHRLNHFPGQLSGGEQQRAAIARAVAKNPELLLCDEPTGALDVQTGKKVLALLRNLQRRLSMSIVIVTHNTAISAMADRIVRIRSGQITQAERNLAPREPEQIEW